MPCSSFPAFPALPSRDPLFFPPRILCSSLPGSHALPSQDPLLFPPSIPCCSLPGSPGHCSQHSLLFPPSIPFSSLPGFSVLNFQNVLLFPLRIPSSSLSGLSALPLLWAPHGSTDLTGPHFPPELHVLTPPHPALPPPLGHCSVHLPLPPYALSPTRGLSALPHTSSHSSALLPQDFKPPHCCLLCLLLRGSPLFCGPINTHCEHRASGLSAPPRPALAILSTP